VEKEKEGMHALLVLEARAREYIWTARCFRSLYSLKRAPERCSFAAV
jgi:hypothetical protein